MIQAHVSGTIKALSVAAAFGMAAFSCTSGGGAGKSSSPSELGPDGSGVCKQESAGRFCLRGTPVLDTSGSEFSFDVGDHLAVEVYPAGCHSSSCTDVVQISCSVAGSGSDHVVASNFCLRDTTAEREATLGCTADCNTAIAADCTSSDSLAAGQHTVTMAGATISFTVPGKMPQTDACAEVRDAF